VNPAIEDFNTVDKHRSSVIAFGLPVERLQLDARSVLRGAAMDLESYVVTNSFFGEPFIDLDEVRGDPCRHRHIHGGFAGTDTKFTFYFPPEEEGKGRMYKPLEGAHAGHEDDHQSRLGARCRYVNVRALRTPEPARPWGELE
jgi:hypothetical protein